MGGYYSKRNEENFEAQLVPSMDAFYLAFSILFISCFCYVCFDGTLRRCCRGPVVNIPLPRLPPPDLTTQPRQEPSIQYIKNQTKESGEQAENEASGSKEVEGENFPPTIAIPITDDPVDKSVQTETSTVSALNGNFSRPCCSAPIEIPRPPRSNHDNVTESSRQQIPFFLAKERTSTPNEHVDNIKLKDDWSKNFPQTCGSISLATDSPTPCSSLNESVLSTGFSSVDTVAVGPRDTIAAPSTSSASLQSVSIPIYSVGPSASSSPTLNTFRDTTAPSDNSIAALNIPFLFSNPSTSPPSAHITPQLHASRFVYYRNYNVDLQDIGVVGDADDSIANIPPEPEALSVFCADCFHRGNLVNNSPDDISDEADVDSEGFPRV